MGIRILKQVAEMWGKEIRYCIYCGKPFIALNKQHKVCSCDICQKKCNAERQKRFRDKIKEQSVGGTE